MVPSSAVDGHVGSDEAIHLAFSGSEIIDPETINRKDEKDVEIPLNTGGDSSTDDEVAVPDELFFESCVKSVKIACVFGHEVEGVVFIIFLVVKVKFGRRSQETIFTRLQFSLRKKYVQ